MRRWVHWLIGSAVRRGWVNECGLQKKEEKRHGVVADRRSVASLSFFGANDRTLREGRGAANDSCRQSVAAPKPRTSDQIANDQIPTTEPCTSAA